MNTYYVEFDGIDDCGSSYYYYNNDSISLPYNYSQNLNNTFPRSLKFISRGGNSHAKNPIFGDTRPPKPHIGEMFFDTSLSPSKYICWNGSNWVNLDGTSLSNWKPLEDYETQNFIFGLYINTQVEGFVVKDSNGYMFKFKTLIL